jgi:membrane protease YdiL (CAAX protease family)
LRVALLARFVVPFVWYAGASSVLAAAIPTWWWLRRTGRPWRDVLPLRGFPPALVVVLPVMLFAFAADLGIIAAGVERLLPPMKWIVTGFNLLDAPRTGFLWAFLVVAVVGPVMEEILFRGVILNALLDGLSPWRAVLSAALLFAVSHLNAPQFVAALGLGILFGWLRVRTRSLLPGIAGHAFINAWSTVARHVRHVGLGPTSAPQSLGTPAAVLTTFVVLAVFAALGWWLLAIVTRPAGAPGAAAP